MATRGTYKRAVCETLFLFIFALVVFLTIKRLVTGA